MQSRLFLGIGVFVIAIVTAGLLSNESGIVAIAIVATGSLIAIFLLLLPAIEDIIRRSHKGKLSPKGFEWEIRKEPVNIVVPSNPTNTSTNEEAVQLCNQGRKIVEEKGALGDALKLFIRAFEIDNQYWEALVNQANMLFLLGKVQEAMAIATDVRIRFGNISLAYAKASLIIAKAVEVRIPESISKDEYKIEYRRIVDILEESLKRCRSHITTRISLGRALLLSGAEKQVIEKFLEESLRYEKFAESFLNALESEQLVEQFKYELPDLWELLKGRRGKNGSE